MRVLKKLKMSISAAKLYFAHMGRLPEYKTAKSRFMGGCPQAPLLSTAAYSAANSSRKNYGMVYAK